MSFDTYPNRGHGNKKRRRWPFKRSAVAGQARKRSKGFARIGGTEITAAELVKQMDLLNAQAESLNVAATIAGAQGKGEGFPFEKWARFMDARLPTNALSSVVAPIYEDGPIGWRQWYKGNRKTATSALARLFSAESTWRVMNEYKASLASYYAAATAAKMHVMMKGPPAPGVVDMPGPIDPVEIPGQGAVEDLVSPLLSTGNMQGAIASALGLTPTQLRRVAVGSVVAVALAAAYGVSK